MSQVVFENKKKKRASWPVIGFLLAVAFGFLSWVIAPYALDFVERTLPQFQVAGVSAQTMRIIVTVILFLILSSIAGFIIAITAPKKGMNVKYSDLEKERAQMLAEKRYEKVRARRVAQKMREDVKKRNS